MRIAFLSTMNGSPWGGSELLWTKSARAALMEGHHVLSVTYRWDSIPEQIQELKAAGANLILRPRSRPRLSLAERLKHRIERYVRDLDGQFLREIEGWRPDFLCVSQGTSFDAAFDDKLNCFLSQSRMPYGVICQWNDERPILRDDYSRERVRLFYRGARWVAFVAKGNQERAELEIASFIENGVVVQNPVNLSDVDAVAWPTVSGNEIRLASVARLENRCKGQDILLKVLSSEKWRVRPWQLGVYGGGPDALYLATLASVLKVNERVTFKGHESDVKKIWSENHLLVMPSYSEGTPLSLVESMVSARPAVATDVGGISEWLTDGVTGFLAAAPTVKAFDLAMERAWAELPRLRELGENARQVAMQKVELDPGRALLDLIIDGRASSFILPQRY